MKGSIRYQVPVGLLFLVALGILIYYTVLMSHEFIEPKYHYPGSVYIPNATGLEPGSRVKVNGVEVGEVKEIELRNDLVFVSMKLYKEFVLYENYIIKINSDTMFTSKQVSIYTGSPMDSAGKQYALVKERENLRGSYEDPLGSFASMVEENRENVHATIQNLREITTKINKGKGTVGKLINEDSVHAEANVLIEDTNNLIRDINETIEDAREQAPITSFIRAALTFF